MSSRTSTVRLVLPSVIKTSGLLSFLILLSGFQALAQIFPSPQLILYDMLNRVETGKLDEGGTICSPPSMPSPSNHRSVAAGTENVGPQVHFQVTTETGRNRYLRMADPWTLCAGWKYTGMCELRTEGCPTERPRSHAVGENVNGNLAARPGM